MFQVNFEIFVFLFVSTGMLLIFGLWLYYDRRDRNLFESERSRVIFHCVKCGHLYTAKSEVEVATCPSCQFKNSRLKF